MRKYTILLIFVSAFVIRFISLDQSLWLDEATTANVVQQYGFAQIIQNFSPRDFHPPLYYLFMKAWTNMFGYSEIALRFPSIIFSLLSGWVVYLIAKRLANKKVALWAAVFFLFNPLIIYYSQEARMYMMATFLLTSTFYFILELLTGPAATFPPASAPPTYVGVRAVGSPSSRVTRQQFTLILVNIFLFLSLLTFYGSVFFILALYSYLLVKKKYRLLVQILPGFVAGLLLVSPLLQQQFANSKQVLAIVVNWTTVLGQATIKNLLLFPIKFATGRVSFEPKILSQVVLGLWTVSVFYYVAKGGLKNRRMLYFFAAPIALGFIFSFYKPLLQYFRFLYLVPFMTVLVALGTRTKTQRTVLFLGFFLLSLVYLFDPNQHREDWKALSKALPKDTKIYIISSSSDPLKYYRPDVVIADIRSIKNGKELHVVPYTTDIYGYDYQRVYKSKGYELKEKRNFRGLIYERWTR
ncbi:glycosyltransferase family 39 protein [Candidatus Roizmanbacteria bacterium]|nr:glycosyltransferase family 39 protein [Candidatus Roizmanbacteria bacterium]